MNDELITTCGFEYVNVYRYRRQCDLLLIITNTPTDHTECTLSQVLQDKICWENNHRIRFC